MHMEMCRKNWAPRACLSRSLKVNGIDTDQSGTCDSDFLLTFPSKLVTMG